MDFYNKQTDWSGIGANVGGTYSQIKTDKAKGSCACGSGNKMTAANASAQNKANTAPLSFDRNIVSQAKAPISDYAYDPVLREMHERMKHSLFHKFKPYVRNKNGVLHFQNKEALHYIIDELEKEILYYDYLDEPRPEDGEEGDKFVSDEPVLELFENAFGFSSLRKTLETQENIILENGGEPEQVPDSFIGYDVLEAMLTPNYEIMIGNSYFKFWNGDILVEIPDSDGHSVEKARAMDSSLFKQSNAIVHNIGDDDNYGDIIRPDVDYTIKSNLGSTTTSGKSNSEQDAYAGRGCDELEVKFEIERQGTNSLNYRFKDTSNYPSSGCYQNTIIRNWKIRQKDNNNIVTTPYNSSNFEVFMLDYDKEYEVCLEVSINCDSGGICKKEICKTLETTFVNTPPTNPGSSGSGSSGSSSPDCCKVRLLKKGFIFSPNLERGLKWKISVVNLHFLLAPSHGIFSSTKHYKRNWRNKMKKRKANQIFAGFEGTAYERSSGESCGQPYKIKSPLNFTNTRKNKRRMRSRWTDIGSTIAVSQSSIRHIHYTLDGSLSYNATYEGYISDCN